jgi:hypothetical protein
MHIFAFFQCFVLLLLTNYCPCSSESTIRGRTIKGDGVQEPRLLEDIPDRKTPPSVSKENFKIARSDWRNFLVEAPSAAPSDPLSLNLSFTPSNLPSPAPSSVATSPPTSLQDGVYEYLLQFVDKKILLDDKSYLFKAYSWLIKNANIGTFDNSRIRQRFALAAVYYSTNKDLTSWEEDEFWVTDENECSWYGVLCKNGDIVALNFTSNGLEEIFPDEISMLQEHLLALEMGDNNVINANQELRWMGQLTKLNLLDIQDTGFTANGIPSFIGLLTDLRTYLVEMSFLLFSIDTLILMRSTDCFSIIHSLIY